MVLRKVLVVAAVMSLLGGGVIAGQAAGLSIPKNHQLAIRAAHGAKTLLVQESTSALSNTSTTYIQLTGDSVTIPATGNFRVVVRFSGESDCQATNWCTAELRVNGVATNPKSGTDFAFDSPGGNLWTSNAMQGVSDQITGTGVPSLASIEVYWAVVGGGTWRMDDWAVTAEVWKV